MNKHRKQSFLIFVKVIIFVSFDPWATGEPVVHITAKKRWAMGRSVQLLVVPDSFHRDSNTCIGESGRERKSTVVIGSEGSCHDDEGIHRRRRTIDCRVIDCLLHTSQERVDIAGDAWGGG